MSRILLVLVVLVATAGAVVAYGRSRTDRARQRHRLGHAAQARRRAGARRADRRGQGGEFALRAKINGVNAPMVIDTGATSVVLTYETAKAAGLPLELLNMTSMSRPPAAIPGPPG